MSNSFRPHIRWIASVLSLLCCSPLMGASGIWMGSDNTQEWTDPTQWQGGIVPGSTSSTNNTDSATFNTNAGDTLISIPSNLNLQRLIFEPGGGIFTFGTTTANEGPAIRLSSNASIQMTLGYLGSKVTFNAPLELHGNATFQNSSTNADNFANPPQLIFNGNISKAFTGDATLTLSGSAGSRNRAAAEANLISGIISDGTNGGTLSVTLSGTSAVRGAWNLTGLNTFTGDFTGTGGALFFNTITNKGVASSLGAGTTIRLSGGTHLMYSGSATTTDRDFMIGSGGATWFNNGSGTITISEAGSISLASSTFVWRGSRDFIIDAKVTGNAGMSRTDPGTVYFNNTQNDFTGNISISYGAFNAKSIADSGVISALGRGSEITLGQTNGGTGLSGNIGRLTISATSDQSTNRTLRINNGLNTGVEVGGGIIENATANTILTLRGNVIAANASTRSTLTLGGAGDGVFAGIVTNNANLELTKNGNGTWSLSGANTYQGGTKIDQGTLLINNTSGSGTGTGSVLVNGTATLGGTGSLSGSAGKEITLANTAKIMIGNSHGLSAGVQTPLSQPVQASQLTLGSATGVTLNLRGSIQFDLFSNQAGTTSTEADRLVLRSTASTLDFSAKLEIVNSSNSRYQWTGGEWQLIDWSGVNPGVTTINGTPTVTLPTNALRIGYQWDTSELMSTGVIKSIADPDALYWTANGANEQWDNTDNWTSPVVPTLINDVIFGANSQAGTTLTRTNLADDRTVRNLLLTGEKNYEIYTSKGVLYMRGNLLHSQGGDQRITTQIRPNQSGTQFLFLVDSGSLHLGSIMSSANQSWTIDGAGDISVENFSRRDNHNINITKNGTGTLTIRGFNANSHENGFTSAGVFLRGSFTINDGTVRIRDERSLGGTPDNFAAAHLTLNGGRLVSYGPTVIDDENRGVTFGSAGASLGAEANQSLTMATPITGSGHVDIRGEGQVTFAFGNSYSGNTQVSQGKFWVSNLSGSATGSGSVRALGTTTLGGYGIIAPAAGKSIQVDPSAFLTIGMAHGSNTPESLWLGNPNTVSDVDIVLQGTLQFDITSAGSFAEFGDSIYQSTSTNGADLLILSTSGDIDLSSAKIQLAADSTDGWAAGQRWKIIDWSHFTPEQIQTLGLTLINEQIGQYNLQTHSAADGLYVIAAVPEPSKILLVILSSAAMILRRKRRS